MLYASGTRLNEWLSIQWVGQDSGALGTDPLALGEVEYLHKRFRLARAPLTGNPRRSSPKIDHV